MNIIVANKQKKIIDNANIDAIKDFKGLFNVDDLISKFKNYFFSKLILDATSIVDFTSRTVLEKLSTSIGAERLVILLPEKPLPPKEFVNLLLELKIYNFSNKIEDVVTYIDKPNTYEEVMKKMEYDESFYVDNSIKNTDDESNIPDNSNSSEQGNNPSFGNESMFLINDNKNVNNASFVKEDNFFDKKIIGFKNVTIHAGTTTLIFLLKELAQNKYKKRVLAVEVDSDEFKYYHDDTMINVGRDILKKTIANSNAEIVFVDLNNYDGDMSFFNDVIYLVEPSIIKLNRLMINDKFAFRSLVGKKVILNQSFLTNNEVDAFAKEAGVNIFMNISPLNDRISNNLVAKLLDRLL